MYFSSMTDIHYVTKKGPGKGHRAPPSMMHDIHNPKCREAASCLEDFGNNIITMSNVQET